MLKGDSELTYAVIGKAMEVHREVGPGLQEPFYHRILSDKLKAVELWHQFKPAGILTHRGLRTDEFEADVLFDGQLVIEAKVLERAFAPDHYTQILCYQTYLKLLDLPWGIIVNFAKHKVEHQYVIHPRK
jgi:GxxExxY protein